MRRKKKHQLQYLKQQVSEHNSCCLFWNTTRTSSNLNTTSNFIPCVIINTLIHGHREKSNNNTKKLTCSSFLCELRCTLTQLLQSYKPNLQGCW